MFKKIILYISVAAVLIIAAPTKAQAAFPDGDAVGAMLMGGWPVGGAIGVTGQSSKVPVMFGGTVRFGVISINISQFFLTINEKPTGILKPAVKNQYPPLPKSTVKAPPGPRYTQASESPAGPKLCLKCSIYPPRI